MDRVAEAVDDAGSPTEPPVPRRVRIKRKGIRVGMWEDTWRRAERVEGWLSEVEGRLLYDLAREVRTGCIVEIGSWLGRSTICLGCGSLASKFDETPFVYAVDTWSGYTEKAERGRWGLMKPVFEANMKDAGLFHLVTPLAGDSVGRAVHFSRKVGLLFIDGGHEDPQPRKDYEAWYPWLVPGGVVAFHDTLDVRFPHIRELLHAIVGRGEAIPLFQAGQIVALKKKEREP